MEEFGEFILICVFVLGKNIWEIEEGKNNYLFIFLMILFCDWNFMSCLSLENSFFFRICLDMKLGIGRLLFIYKYKVNLVFVVFCLFYNLN